LTENVKKRRNEKSLTKTLYNKKKHLLLIKEHRKYYKTDQTRFGDIAIYELP